MVLFNLWVLYTCRPSPLHCVRVKDTSGISEERSYICLLKRENIITEAQMPIKRRSKMSTCKTVPGEGGQDKWLNSTLLMRFIKVLSGRLLEKGHEIFRNWSGDDVNLCPPRRTICMMLTTCFLLYQQGIVKYKGCVYTVTAAMYTLFTVQRSNK